MEPKPKEIMPVLKRTSSASPSSGAQRMSVRLMGTIVEAADKIPATTGSGPAASTLRVLAAMKLSIIDSVKAAESRGGLRSFTGLRSVHLLF